MLAVHLAYVQQMNWQSIGEVSGDAGTYIRVET